MLLALFEDVWKQVKTYSDALLIAFNTNNGHTAFWNFHLLSQKSDPLSSLQADGGCLAHVKGVGLSTSALPRPHDARAVCRPTTYSMLAELPNSTEMFTPHHLLCQGLLQARKVAAKLQQTARPSWQKSASTGRRHALLNYGLNPELYSTQTLPNFPQR